MLAHHYADRESRRGSLYFDITASWQREEQDFVHLLLAQA
jgi:hypothetical protein